MTRRIHLLLAWGIVACVAGLTPVPPLSAQEDPEAAQIRASADQLAKAFNAGQVDALVGLFLPKGELIDDQGVVNQGPQELKELFTKFFARFPGASLKLDIESIRLAGPVAIEEGSRFITTKDGGAKAQLRYICIRAKADGQWKIASIREFNNDSAASPGDRLQSLAWLVGDWVNESTDAAVKIEYRWSEDKNFLLGDFLITREGSLRMKSTQRIGWDPLTGKVKSWMFDSDGGYAEGSWAQVEGAWVIKSTAVIPDGQTGSATITLTQKDKDHYTMKGTERIVGDARDDDFEVTVARQAPAPAKSAKASK